MKIPQLKGKYINKVHFSAGLMLIEISRK